MRDEEMMSDVKEREPMSEKPRDSRVRTGRRDEGKEVGNKDTSHPNLFDVVGTTASPPTESANLCNDATTTSSASPLANTFTLLITNSSKPPVAEPYPTPYVHTPPPRSSSACRSIWAWSASSGRRTYTSNQVDDRRERRAWPARRVRTKKRRSEVVKRMTGEEARPRIRVRWKR
jgi:hypothetical protein